MSDTGRGFGLLFEMGCGKTLTAIAIAGAAYEEGAVERLLVVAPASVVPVWPKELKEYADFKYTCRPLVGEKKARLKALDDLMKFPFDALKVAVINYESTWRDGIFEKLQEYNADMIICDESQRIKTYDSDQSMAMHQLGDVAKYKLILSGTPVQNNAMDIFSQYRFLDKTVFGLSYYRFRGRYAQMGGWNNKNIVGYHDLDELIKKEHSIAYRVTKAEALDLPEQEFETRYIEMSKQERLLYDTLRRTSCAELESGGQVTATTVLTKLLRLQQLTGGFLVKDESDRPEQVSTAKLDTLKDIITDYILESASKEVKGKRTIWRGGKKLVVFARFIPEVTAIQTLADKLLPDGLKYVMLYGDIPQGSRGRLVEQFQTDPDTVLFIGQIDTAGTGITLTAADTCVYYSKTYNYATYEQSLSRIHRIGQRNTCTYIDLVVENTVDEMITKALRKKEDLAKTVVDDWRQFFQ